MLMEQAGFSTRAREPAICSPQTSPRSEKGEELIRRGQTSRAQSTSVETPGPPCYEAPGGGGSGGGGEAVSSCECLFWCELKERENRETPDEC